MVTTKQAGGHAICFSGVSGGGGAPREAACVTECAEQHAPQNGSMQLCTLPGGVPAGRRGARRGGV
eukprot:2730512-Alexandrium_andersonii.AAC.1